MRLCKSMVSTHSAVKMNIIQKEDSALFEPHLLCLQSVHHRFNDALAICAFIVRNWPEPISGKFILKQFEDEFSIAGLIDCLIKAKILKRNEYLESLLEFDDRVEELTAFDIFRAVTIEVDQILLKPTQCRTESKYAARNLMAQQITMRINDFIQEELSQYHLFSLVNMHK
ncbi:hypothetical protein SAMN04515617_11885 [Collimonas sp. OK242]|nr:hypothetical protein SAMN04515617_11885 [Collimonas sp. OK242]